MTNFNGSQIRTQLVNSKRILFKISSESDPRWILRTNASDAELWCFLWSTPNKRLSKHWWGWWFEESSRPLWRHCNENHYFISSHCHKMHTIFLGTILVFSPTSRACLPLASCSLSANLQCTHSWSQLGHQRKSKTAGNHFGKTRIDISMWKTSVLQCVRRLTNKGDPVFL